MFAPAKIYKASVVIKLEIPIIKIKKEGRAIMTNKVITISRQFGSGGGEIAKCISQKLNIPYLDREILIESAKLSGISKEHFEKADERRSNSFIFSLVTAHYGGAASPMQFNDIISDDKMFLFTADTIKKLAKEPCVVVGRCADDILQGDNIVRFYIYADIAERIKRIAKLHNLSEKEAANLIKKTDKRRASYYNFYTSRQWGKVENYNMAINSTGMDTDKIADLFINYIENM